MISEVNVLLVVVVVVFFAWLTYQLLMTHNFFLSRSRLDQTKVRENGEE